MLSPDYILRISEGGEAIAEQLHQDIIKRIVDRIALRLSRGEDYILTSLDKWQIEVLRDAGYLREDIEKEIAKYTGLMQQEIAEAMEDAGVTALGYDDAVYKAAGLSPAPLEKSPYLIRMMQRNYEATVGEWVNFTRTTAEACQQAFIQACDTAYHQVSSGALGYAQAYREAIDGLIEHGAMVTYPSGHTDTIETATLRCIRTGIAQATAAITDARMEEMNWDIILVSSHLGARVTGSQDFTNHAWWQGKFYSKSGKDKRFPPFSVCGQGNVQGIHGANCRHSHGPGDGEFNPFREYDSEENQKEYELQQKQRALERRIRESKRKVMGLRQGVESAQSDEAKALMEHEYQKASALLQKRNKAYNDFCEENDLKKLNERIAIAKWDRSQAAKARTAAKKYAERNTANLKDAEYNGRENDVSDLSILSVKEINIRGTKNLLAAYERRRLHYGLNMTPAEELVKTEFNTFVESYDGVSAKTADAFEKTIDKLSQRYYTGLTKVEVGEPKKFLGSGVFASVKPMPTVGANTLTLNPLKTKDYSKLTERIKELSQKGFCVKIADDHLGEYVATHEFAHTLINLKVDSYKNYVGIDAKYYSGAKAEIESLYERYMTELGDLSARRKTVESKFFSASNQVELVKIQEEFAQIKAEFASKQISQYSLENADEFMAEGFTDCMIGVNPSEYSKMIIGVIDRYFGRR